MYMMKLEGIFFCPTDGDCVVGYSYRNGGCMEAVGPLQSFRFFNHLLYHYIHISILCIVEINNC